MGPESSRRGISMQPWQSDDGFLKDQEGHWGGTLMVIAYLVVAFTMIVMPFAMYALYSGAMRWILTIVMITIAGLVAIKVLYPLGERIKMGGAVQSPRADKDNYDALKEMAKRAERGFLYSQKALNERMAEAFLQKLRVKRGIQPHALYRLAEDKKRLYQLCGDKEIASFVVDSKAAMALKTERRSLFGKKGMAKEGAAYRIKAERMIAKIEAWEG
jgi:hypothetical protein